MLKRRENERNNDLLTRGTTLGSSFFHQKYSLFDKLQNRNAISSGTSSSARLLQIPHHEKPSSATSRDFSNGPVLVCSAKKRRCQRTTLGRRFSKQYALLGQRNGTNEEGASNFSASSRDTEELKVSCSSSATFLRTNEHLPCNPRPATSLNRRSTFKPSPSASYQRMKSPQNPFGSFDKLNGTMFFETGISNLTSWSVFKTGATKGIKSPRSENSFGLSSLPQSTPLPEAIPEPVLPSSQAINKHTTVARKLNYNDEEAWRKNGEKSDQSDLEKLVNKNSVPDIYINSTVYSSVKKKVKLSTINEELDKHSTDEQTIVKRNKSDINSSREESLLITKLCDIRNKTIMKRKEIQEKLDELNKIEEEGDKLMEKLKELKLSTTDENVTVLLAEENKENKNNFDENLCFNQTGTSPATDNKVIKTDYRLTYSALKTPKQDSAKKALLRSICYTPNSLSLRLDEQMKNISNLKI